MRRRLDRAPGDRFRAQAGATPIAQPEPGGRHQPARWARSWLALPIAALGALAVVLVYGFLAMTTGLLAIAGATGFLVGFVSHGRGAAATRAPTLAGVSMVVGILGGWLVSLAQGGVAGPLDYVAQTLGLLAVIVPIVAATAAWLGRR